jgi:hypothetical protein
MRPLSWHAIQALRYLSKYPMHGSVLNKFRQVHIACLFYRKLIEQRGTDIGPTAEGFEVLDQYHKSGIPKRLRVTETAPSVRKYIRLRNVVEIKRRKAA